MMELVSPSALYKDSFLEAAAAIAAEGDARFLKSYNAYDNFDAYCQALHDQSTELALKDGLVPVTTFWLIDNNCFAGRAGIRHYLNENLLKIGGHIGYIVAPKYRRLGYGTKILELSLKEALKMGITRVLITCDYNNIASAKIIEKNGGKFENEELNEETGIMKRRYWIAQ